MKLWLTVISMFTMVLCTAQPYAIRGTLSCHNCDSSVADISLLQKNKLVKSKSSAAPGAFRIDSVPQGAFTLSISLPGFAAYNKQVNLLEGDINLGTILLQPIAQTLDEVKIVTRALAVVQKDDTMEYNSSAYKVNPDADAADLVRKMPGVEVNGKEVRAQGEQVIKVMVDGKPFFGNDPWAVLKNLPADVVQKVQVYNEKSDQERFTGFREGPVSKTINIVTKPDKRNGFFGNIFGGGGSDNNGQGVYGAGLSMNRFAGDKRISVTAQANNVNIQNFSDGGPASAGGGGGNGITDTRAAGINYSDKWGKKVDVNGSYFFNQMDNENVSTIHRTYVLPGTAGQVYDERSPASSANVSHRGNLRITYTPDSMSTLLVQPAINVTTGETKSARQGKTTTSTQGSEQLLNTTTASSGSNRNTIAANGNILYTRRFHKKGRTFSAGITASGNSANGDNQQYANNVFYADSTPAYALDQEVKDKQQSSNTTANATWTEPVGTGLLKAQYDGSWAPSTSEKRAYNNTGSGYTIEDSLLSGMFTSKGITHKGGLSYLYRQEKFEASAGINGQQATMTNDRRDPPGPAFRRSFTNLLPIATLQYNLSKTRHFSATYTTRAGLPTVSQLQGVVNNTDPLHLSIGNPSLRQPFNHNMTLRYNASSSTGNNLSLTIQGGVVQHYIANAATTATTDTTIGAIYLPSGAQLTMPVNLDGNAMVNGNFNYSVPLKMIKCRVNMGLGGALTRTPAVINGMINYQQSRNANANVALYSNFSEKTDLSLTSFTSLTSSINPVNTALNTTYITQNFRATADLIIWKGIVVSTTAMWQGNFGLAAGFNRNYLLWNMAIGKKLFRKQQGDIRLSAFDLLNNNTNVRRTTTDSYIQDQQTNILQRYVMLVFTYKIRSFGK
ncbi:MAG: outer membrane beta-barrel protein [Taibaiella sp.]|nr:outer membrane beta-barrel protein [Taibaiella sp.]